MFNILSKYVPKIKNYVSIPGIEIHDIMIHNIEILSTKMVSGVGLVTQILVVGLVRANPKNLVFNCTNKKIFALLN